MEPRSLLNKADLQLSPQEGVYTLLTASADRCCSAKICVTLAPSGGLDVLSFLDLQGKQ